MVAQNEGDDRESGSIETVASLKKIEYVIFDLDGLMIDSERIYTDVTNDILAQYGAKMTWEMKAGLMAKPERASAVHLFSFFPDIPLTIDDYLVRRTAALDVRLPHVELLPGIARLVAHLATHGVPIAIATSSRRRKYEPKTAHLQHIFARFSERVECGDDGEGRGQPIPDAERAERARRLVFEDAIPGVQAGKRAGMRGSVWVPDENLLNVGCSQAVEQPDQTLSSLEHFVPGEWGLPPFTTTEQSETKA
ncbi:HAD-like domain-containing protein [Lactarius vividus]|nr:HAD-like domain-containing protein [Lactarius vividus]